MDTAYCQLEKANNVSHRGSKNDKKQAYKTTNYQRCYSTSLFYPILCMCSLANPYSKQKELLNNRKTAL